ncbi:alpha-mannosidase [Psychromicrobium lacuslunae]|uniref:Alpha-mannosidase n=1 Tax=Psychromicrobium lacuslunae TaxID=1618207 RepID=A0A0D4C066_9MICC|nr:glycoside hydrolase family 38 C-terminal domain-containing protein [Psychromicrobium lacuslunae]AJT41746.1 alpha-mannosidase [Psychromicrobium lacuslunae]
MHNDRKLIEDRVARTLHERLRREIHTPIASLQLEVWHVDGGLVDVIHGEPVSPEHALGQEYAPAQLGDAWGPAWSTSWYHLTGKVPEIQPGQTVEVIFNLGFGDIDPGFHAEGMVYLPDGSVLKGLNPKNQWIPVNQQTAPEGRFEVYVEAAANPRIASPEGYLPTLIGDKLTSGPAPLYRLSRADINLFDVELWELCQDLETLNELSRELADTDARRYQILRALERSLDAIDLQDVHTTASAARAELVEVLGSPAAASSHRISAIGHAHIDSAWLWPLRETVRKVGRTSANVVNLLENNTLSGAEDFKFAMSQAQQLAWLRDHRPDVFARVKELVRQGRFIPVGGMWVEPDTNMPGSEAMARQFVYGKRFILEEFGIETEEVWLPDTFGYSAALPQIAKAAGAKWFLTQKISWNTINKFPHHTFNWEGIDGTQIFTHFPPVDTYSSDLSGSQLAHAARNFQEKGAASRSLAPFGWGDGGGGPTREMLARVARNKNLEGAPRLSVESPADFFRAAEQEYQNPPVWSGELYLEFHRGTYTTQAKNKQGNRRSEHLLYEAELWATTAALRSDFEYPYDVFCRIWKQVLLLQFHDILPGTSIAWVHREAAEAYAAIEVELTELIGRTQQALAGQPLSTEAAQVPGALVFNAAPQERGGIPAHSARWVPQREVEQTVSAEETGWLLQNEYLTVRLDQAGLFTSIYDHEQRREVLSGPGNLFQLHPDFPNDWDAWDIDEFYRNTAVDLTELDSIRVEGPSSVLIRRSFGESSIEQRVSLAAGSREIVLEIEVSWFEKEKLLKLAFPLDLQADRSSAEIQFGHLQRPTHSNTSWDAAKFEICAHRWLRVEEPGYGVTLSNDATYGYDVTRQPAVEAGPGQPNGTTIRASILRAPRFPDPQTDQGVHRMRFALLPGSGVSDAVRSGYAINLPERSLPGGTSVEPLIRSDNESVVISAVKLADDQSGDLVVRLYESLGGRARAELQPNFDYLEVIETDLLERAVPQKALQQQDGRLELQLRPFELVTLRFRGLSEV